MDPELELVASRLSQAAAPEDVFGEIKAQPQDMLFILRKQYRLLARVTHPDMYTTEQEQIVAQTTFHLLTEWFNKAKEKVEAGNYGRRVAPSTTVLRTGRREYSVDGTHQADEVFNFYPCSYSEAGRVHRVTLKLVRDPRDGNVVETEVRALRTLRRGKEAGRFSAYIPEVLDAFVYEDTGVCRQAVVLQRYEGWYSLEDVRRAFPTGIDPKDMAWMWRRLLVVLGFAHTNQVIHGAVLPRNIWILPEDHGLMLVNWSHATLDPAGVGQANEAVVAHHAEWYPAEISQGSNPLFGTDIHMSAKCMLWLLGGDLQKRSLPASVPAPIKAFLHGCMLPGNRAPQNAWTLKEEFDELIGRLWGERKFHPFRMKQNP